MKRRVILTIVLCVLSFGCNRTLAQDDNMSLKQIEQNTENTANNTKKGEYEIATIILSGLAFATALITLIYTYRTFKSQRVTQHNTIPRFTQEKQYEVLGAITQHVIDNFIKAGVFRLQMKSTNKKVLLSEVNFMSYFIDVNEIHLELFYDSNVSPCFLDETQYSLMSNLKSEFDIYNHYIQIIARHFMNENLNIDTVVHEFDSYILRGSIDLITKLLSTTKKVFNEREDLRDEIVKYIWLRKNLYTLLDDDGEPLNMIPQEELNNLSNKKEFNNIYGIIEDSWDTLFEDYDFSKVLENEISNAGNLYVLVYIAMIGDKVLNNQRNMIITFNPKETKHTTTKTEKGKSLK